MPRWCGHSGQLICVEGAVSNCALTLAEIQSKQVEAGCRQPRVSCLDGNAFVFLVSAQILHSI